MSLQIKFRSFKKRMFKGGDVFCAWCAKKLTPEITTIDHNVPLMNGGSNRVSNLLLSCYPCNHIRGKDDALLRRRFLPKGVCNRCGVHHQGKCTLKYGLNPFGVLND